MVRGLMRRSHKVRRVALLTNIDHAVALVLPILVGQPGDVGLLDSIQARGRVPLRVQDPERAWRMFARSAAHRGSSGMGSRTAKNPQAVRTP